MKIFRMADVEKIEEMLATGKTVEVEWKDGATGEIYTETVKSVRWDGLVFTTGARFRCVCFTTCRFESCLGHNV